MIELPEAAVIARQIGETLTGKRIQSALANYSPHKFAWYSGEPAQYQAWLAGKTITGASSSGNHIEIFTEGRLLALSTPVKYHLAGEKRPQKHQLLLEFEDGTALSSTVQMWGALLCLEPGEPGGLIDYRASKTKPSALSPEFTREYFATLFNPETAVLSAKAFLATEQRIPGLGNGVLQDILWTAKIYPRRKMGELNDRQIQEMYEAILSVLGKMVEQGGRDTERDLFGQPGGYCTILSKNTAGAPCPACGTTIVKESFMGGSIYSCPGCQF